MNLPSLAPTAGSTFENNHLVEFYETEAFLVDTVSAFLAPALEDGDAVIVVATASHRASFETAIRHAGVDLDAAVRDARFLTFDAAELLSHFMVGGGPDETAFRATIGAAMDHAALGGRRIRVYGEMVAILWGDGNGAAALALEDLWNELGEARPFTLLCAYPMDAFANETDASAFRRICEQHTMVIPSESYSLRVGTADQSRAVAELQQQRDGLQTEVRRLVGLQQRDAVVAVREDASGEQRHGEQRHQAGDRRDQTGEERDQAGEQRDQAGDRRDQAGEQRDQAGDRRDQAGQERDQAGIRRDEAGEQRDQAGDQRDQAADQRDQVAEQRDQAADQRDQAAERSESSATAWGTPAPPSLSALARREAASDRKRSSQDRRAGASERIEAELDRDTALADRGAGASERTEAELDRDTALADRGAGASERTEAELDRDTALADRGASARDRENSSHDDLTGAYLRGAGFIELERDIGRARREGQSLVLVFVDVDRLKAINDSRGHAAGDRMLSAVASGLKSKLRPHDLIIRYGGDEFVCAISGVKAADARKRMALVNAALAAGPEPGSVSVGLSELLPLDSPQDLVARADAALYRKRRRQRSSRLARSTSDTPASGQIPVTG
jgi:diguanylate cyclase (GGDEF)-like protein